MKPVLRIAAVLVVLTVLTDSSTAMIYTKCGLAKDLLTKCRFPRSELNNWMCLARWESSYNTAAQNYNADPPPSTDYGIFQINDYYWCKKATGTSINGCGINCPSLLNNDITDDCRCARIIYNRQGFSAWVAWRNHCRGQDLRGYTQGCNL